MVMKFCLKMTQVIGFRWDKKSRLTTKSGQTTLVLFSISLI